MKILLAESSGFCFGVNNSIDITNKTIAKHKEVFSYGPPIHNLQVINDLEKKGLVVINDLDDIKEGKLIIRSHGVGLKTYNELKRENIEVIDTTCPIVRKVQNKVNEYFKMGYDIIIIGDSNHPEVIGINGWCEDKGYIINSEEELNSLPIFSKICVVGQTTMTEEKFIKITQLINKKYKNSEVKIINTLCNITRKRQEACAKLAKKVDAMIVIGGYHSSNTQKLVKISKMHCDKTYHIETKLDLNLEELSAFDTVGITAGASTPDWIIKEVIDKLREI